MNFAFTGNRPKEPSPNEDEAAKIPDYEPKKRLKNVAEKKELMPVFKCAFCDKTFLTKRSLNHHVKKSPAAWKCNYCAEGFETKVIYKRVLSSGWLRLDLCGPVL